MTSMASTTAASFNVEALPSTPSLFLHCAVFLSGNRIISDETFRLETFQGKEGVSTLFEYELELHGNSSQSDGQKFTFDDIIGRPITVGIQYPNQDTHEERSGISFAQAIGGATAGPELALFNGVITSFAVKNWGKYRITMKPALHFLTLTNHYKVYSQKTICDLINELLEAQQIACEPFQFSQQNLAVIRKQDWLQAGETDFEFLQRVLGKAHLYFYFKHTGTSHSLVFSNLANYLPVFADARPLRYDFTGADALGMLQSDIIADYSYQRNLSSSGVAGVLTQQGAAWQHNHIVNYVSYLAADAPDTGPLPFNLYKSVQYGGSSDEVQDIVDATKSTIASASCALTGSSYCAHFRAAHSFTMRSGSDADASFNPIQANLETETFVLTMVSHNANADGSYQNQFQASSASDLITPYSPQETQQGSLLAIVMAHGSGAVQDPSHFGAPSSFDPENNQFSDTMNTPADFPQRGVYVRFSTAASNSDPVWVKLAASMQTVPTIGSIVQVSRAQDTSELPEIQNIIQTNGSMLVVPSGWLANTHVGSSYSTNYGNSKNINYGATSHADLQQATNIVGAAYDSGRFDSVGFTQGTNYSFSCADSLASGAQPSSGELFGSDAVASDILSASESFGSTYSRLHANTTRSFSTVVNSVNISNADFTTNTANTGVTTNITNSGVTTNITTSGATTNTTTSGVTTNITTSGETTNLTTTGLTLNTTISGLTKNITLSGDTWNTSTTGDLFEINTSGNTTRNSTSLALTETTVAGVHTVNGVVETKAENQTALVVININTNGTTTNTISGGDTNNIVTTGMTSNVNTTGESTNVETAGPGAMVSTRDAQPHVDNIVSRVSMIEVSWVFM
jgi:type VI secretion system secreted protein VgrG